MTLPAEDALVERIARRVAELIREDDQMLLTAEQAAKRLGRGRQWVYEHAAEIGAARLGDGPKARLGIPAGAIARYLHEQAAKTATPATPTAPHAAAQRRRNAHAGGSALKARGALTRPDLDNDRRGLGK